MPAMQSYASLFALVLSLSAPVFGQDQNVNFNQVINLNGDMRLNRLQFPDGSRIEVFGQEQRQMLVNQNPAPLGPNRVIGSTGQPFIQMSATSMTIATNNATDFVGGQIEFAIPNQMLQQQGVVASNTFVAKLSPDRQMWMLMESVKAVNATDSTVRMVKQTSLDGEYMLIGRRTPETSQVLTPFGADRSSTVQVNGAGIQELQFQDGFKMTVRTTQPMLVTTDVINGVSGSMLTDQSGSINNFRYLVTTNLAAVQPGLNQMMALVQLPLNADRLMSMALRMGAGPTDQVSLGIQQRPVLANPGGAAGNLNSLPQKRTAPARYQIAAAAAAAQRQRTGGQTGNNLQGGSNQNLGNQIGSNLNNNNNQRLQNGGNNLQNGGNQRNGQNGNINQGNLGNGINNGNLNNGNLNNNFNNQPSPVFGNNPVASQLLLAPTFTPITSNTVLDRQNNRLAVMVNQLDGEFIVTMSLARNGQQPAQPQQGQQPGQGQPQQGQPAQGGQTPTVPIGGTPSGTTPGQAKRQVKAPLSTGTPTPPPSAPGNNKVLMTMDELKAMVQQQKNNGVFPVWTMMEEYANSQGKTLLTPPAKPAKRAPIPVTEDSAVVKDVRAIAFSG